LFTGNKVLYTCTLRPLSKNLIIDTHNKKFMILDFIMALPTRLSTPNKQLLEYVVHKYKYKYEYKYPFW
jgi:hypothetical protein